MKHIMTKTENKYAPERVNLGLSASEAQALAAVLFGPSPVMRRLALIAFGSGAGRRV